MELEFRPSPKPSHNRRVKKRGDRSKFSKMVRDKLKMVFDNQCQECGGKGLHIHHVKFRSQGGRGCFTNGLLLCNNDHKMIHANPERARYWQKVYKEKYGPFYFMDREDLEYKYLTQELKESDKEVKEWNKYNEHY